MNPREFAEIGDRWFSPFTVLIAIVAGEQLGRDSIVNSGTGSLISTGRCHFLVTNHHVYDKFRELRRKDRTVRLAISGEQGHSFVDISEADLKSDDKRFDLAILDIPAAVVKRLGKLFYVGDAWPPRPPQVGMFALAYGYPGEGRVVSGNVVGASAIIFAFKVDSVTDHDFKLCHANYDISIHDPVGTGHPKSFGGMSGSAVFLFSKEPTGNYNDFSLGGFMTEASESMVVASRLTSSPSRAISGSLAVERETGTGNVKQGRGGMPSS